MTSFVKCLQTNVRVGKLTQKKADIAEEAYFRAFKKYDGKMSESQAINRAMFDAVSQITKMNNAKTWARVNELRKVATLADALQKTRRPDRELVTIGNKLELAQRRVLGQVDAIIWRLIEENRPRMAGLIRTVRNPRNIVDAIYGRKIDDEAAKIFANDYKTVHKWFRRRANMEGAALDDIPEGRLGIVEDVMKMRAAEKKFGKKEAKEAWIKDHMDTVDWSLMDKELAEESAEKILEKHYENLITEGNSQRSSGFHSTSLANRLNGKNRSLYFKDAESWHYINEKYGSGNIYQQLISERETWSKDIALLEVLGPNPEMALRHLTDKGGLALNRAAVVSDYKGVKRNIVNKTEKEAKVLINRYEIFAHKVANGEYSGWVQVLNTSRSLTMTAVLSSAFFANTADLGFGAHQAAMLRIPAMRYVMRALGTFATMSQKETRTRALRAGLVGDGMVELALNSMRYIGAFDGYHAARVISDVVYRAQFLTAWTQSMRWGWGMELMGTFSDHRDNLFEDLPFMKSLKEYGITEDDWNLFRSIKGEGEEGKLFLRPIDLATSKRGDRLRNQRVADKFFDFMNDTGRKAVPTTDTRVQQSFGGYVGADTVLGQLARTVGSLKSFPMFILMNHLYDGMAKASPRGKLGYLITLIVTMTIMGAMTTQLKELNRGRDLRNMNPLEKGGLDFWGRALLNGGSLGFLGDALFNSVNNYRGGGIAQMLAGPHTEAINAARDLTIGELFDLAQGKDIDPLKKATAFLSDYTPIPWPIKLAVQRMITDEIVSWADPRAKRNAIARERNRRKERGQASWWGEYKSRPERAPDWGAIFGGSDR